MFFIEAEHLPAQPSSYSATSSSANLCNSRSPFLLVENPNLKPGSWLQRLGFAASYHDEPWLEYSCLQENYRCNNQQDNEHPGNWTELNFCECLIVGFKHGCDLRCHLMPLKTQHQQIPTTNFQILIKKRTMTARCKSK